MFLNLLQFNSPAPLTDLIASPYEHQVVMIPKFADLAFGLHIHSSVIYAYVKIYNNQARNISYLYYRNGVSLAKLSHSLFYYSVSDLLIGAGPGGP